MAIRQTQIPCPADLRVGAPTPLFEPRQGRQQDVDEAVQVLSDDGTPPLAAHLREQHLLLERAGADHRGVQPAALGRGFGDRRPTDGIANCELKNRRAVTERLQLCGEILSDRLTVTIAERDAFRKIVAVMPMSQPALRARAGIRPGRAQSTYEKPAGKPDHRRNPTEQRSPAPASA